MKKEDNCYIEDILNSNKTETNEKTDNDDNKDDDDKIKTENNEKEKKLGDSMIQLDEKNNYNLHEIVD